MVINERNSLKRDLIASAATGVVVFAGLEAADAHLNTPTRKAVAASVASIISLGFTAREYVRARRRRRSSISQ